MVGDTGIEPVTPTMSMCSPAELIARSNHPLAGMGAYIAATPSNQGLIQ